MSEYCVIEMHDLGASNRHQVTSPARPRKIMQPRVAWSHSKADVGTSRILQFRLPHIKEIEYPQQLVHKQRLQPDVKLIKRKISIRRRPVCRDLHAGKIKAEMKVTQSTSRIRSPKRKTDFEENQMPHTTVKQLSPPQHTNINHLSHGRLTRLKLSPPEPTPDELHPKENVAGSPTETKNTRTEQEKTRAKLARRAKRLKARVERAKARKGKAHKKRAKKRKALSPRHRTALPSAAAQQREANVSKPSATARPTERTDARAVDIQKQRATRTKQQRATVDFLGNQQLVQLKQLFKHVCASRRKSREREDMEEEVRRHMRQMEACIKDARDLDIDDENFDHEVCAHCKAFMELNSTAIATCMKLRSLTQSSK